MDWLLLTDTRTPEETGGYTVEPVVIHKDDDIALERWLPRLYPDDTPVSEMHYDVEPVDKHFKLIFEIGCIVDKYGNLANRALMFDTSWLVAVKDAILQWYKVGDSAWIAELHSIYEGSIVNYATRHYSDVWDLMLWNGWLGINAPLGTLPGTGEVLVNTFTGNLLLRNNPIPTRRPGFAGFREGTRAPNPNIWMITSRDGKHYSIPRDTDNDNVKLEQCEDISNPGWYTLDNHVLVKMADD